MGHLAWMLCFHRRISDQPFRIEAPKVVIISMWPWLKRQGCYGIHTSSVPTIPSHSCATTKPSSTSGLPVQAPSGILEFRGQKGQV